MAAPETSASLLIRIRNPEDSESWALFGSVYAPIVFRFLTSRGLQEADAGDVTQEVLVEVARCIRSFDYQPERGRFRNWLAIITRRRLNKFWRKNLKEEHLEVEKMGVDRTSDAQWIDAWQSELLKAALDRARSGVKESTWKAFQMTWIEDVPAADVSEELGLPIDLVYAAKARTLKRLEDEIRMLGDDCGWIEKA